MANHSGICYTWSGDKKMYEPDLFKAQLDVYSYERCYRHDSANSYTLVFEHDDRKDGFHAYLPYNGMSINHSIQDNGEDHYNLLVTYEGPKNWSPPAGLNGPFYGTYGLKYPYYRYSSNWADYVNAWYNDEWKFLGIHAGMGNTYYDGNKKNK